MRRNKQLQTVEGQLAYQLYCDWMRANHRIAPSADSFKRSQYYRSFFKFAEFVQKTKIPDTDKYIRVMIKKQLPPTLWTANEAYGYFIDYFDANTSPLHLATNSLKTLLKISDELGIDLENVFEHLSAGEIIELIRQRRLSPWLLLNSTAFKQKYADSSEEEAILYESIMHFDQWSRKIKKYPDVKSKIKQIVGEAGL